MESGRELFEHFRQGQAAVRPAFVPLVRGLLARVQGEALQALCSDPTLWASSLSQTMGLFNFDGMVVGFLDGLMAQALGLPARWDQDRLRLDSPGPGSQQEPGENPLLKSYLEATNRAFTVMRPRLACLTALTGPVALAEQIFGPEEALSRLAEIKQPLVQTIEAFCRLKPDAMIFLEGRHLALSEMDPRIRRIYNTTKNILSHYQVLAGLYLEGYRSEDILRFKALNLDFYLLGPSQDQAPPPPPQIWQLGQDALGVGVGLPLDDLTAAKELITRCVADYRSQQAGNFFFTSLGPVTREADLDTLHQVVKEVGQARI